MTTQTDDYEGRIRNLETTVTRHDAILPTLATKEDLERFRGEFKADNERLRGEFRADNERLRTEMQRLKFQLLTATAGLLTVAVAVIAFLNRFWG